MGIFVPTSKVLLGGPNTLEPARTNQYDASFTNPGGDSLDGDANYHLRNVSGLERLVEADVWKPGNFEIPYPARIKPSTVTLAYMLLADGSIRNDVIKFWEGWNAITYDVSKDLPGLFSEVVGTGKVVMHAPGPGGGDPVPLITVSLPYIWPSSISFDPMDRSSTEPMAFSVVLNAIHLKIAPQ